MKFRKFLMIGIAALTVAAFSFGLAACKPDTEDPGKDPETPGGDTPVAPAEVTVEGGYGYYPPDQGGIGLELNLYEDGTYYYSQFTSVLYSGTYTAEEASGTDEEGNTIHYTVTFDDQVNFGEETHNIVSDADGTVYLTNMYDDMSLATYNFSKQEDYLEEVVQTVEQFWSTNYAEDFVTATFYSDNSYTLDGINGAGYAGSMGTYTSETAEDGTVTYTMTDGDDSSKVYTITVVGASITLTGTETEYTMTSINPNLVVEVEFTGSNSWGAAVVLHGLRRCNGHLAVYVGRRLLRLRVWRHRLYGREHRRDLLLLLQDQCGAVRRRGGHALLYAGRASHLLFLHLYACFELCGGRDGEHGL